jgi:ABC-type phosphate transport system substrate-binding protein
MKTIRSLFLSLVFTIPALPALAADWVVIANPKAGITHLSRDDVTNIYLGRYRRLASGVTAEPIDQPVDSGLRGRFYRQLVDKSVAEIRAYWARLLFSGQTQPPRVAGNSDDAVHLVSRNPGAMAYVERSKIDSRVTVVFDEE